MAWIQRSKWRTGPSWKNWAATPLWLVELLNEGHLVDFTQGRHSRAHLPEARVA
jgi:hypothetical protein